MGKSIFTLLEKRENRLASVRDVCLLDDFEDFVERRAGCLRFEVLDRNEVMTTSWRTCEVCLRIKVKTLSGRSFERMLVCATF
jgi:hypothetical protein